METFVSSHALERMLERGVTESDIQFALHKFAMSFSVGPNSTQLRALFADGRVLKVWVSGGIPLVEPVIIKTVAWMEAIDE